MLADQNKRETLEIGSQQTWSAADGYARKEVVIETLEAKEGEGNRVNLSVLHVGLAESLRSLSGTKINLRTQAQGNNGGLGLLET